MDFLSALDRIGSRRSSRSLRPPEDETEAEDEDQAVFNGIDIDVKIEDPGRLPPRQGVHECSHCLAVTISPDFSAKLSHGRWRYLFPQSMAEIQSAAKYSCPFFVWLWNQMEVSKTPFEQLTRTKIALDLQSTEESLADVFSATIRIETDLYSWSPGSFEVVVDQGNWVI
jgi:hypothetical protein